MSDPFQWSNGTAAQGVWASPLPTAGGLAENQTDKRRRNHSVWNIPMIPIQHIPEGEFVIIEELVGCVEEVRRLEELGLSQGTPIQVIRKGSPCIARCGDRDLCLRSGDRLQILVSQLPEATRRVGQ